VVCGYPQHRRQTPGPFHLLGGTSLRREKANRPYLGVKGKGIYSKLKKRGGDFVKTVLDGGKVERLRKNCWLQGREERENVKRPGG